MTKKVLSIAAICLVPMAGVGFSYSKNEEIELGDPLEAGRLHAAGRIELGDKDAKTCADALAKHNAAADAKKSKRDKDIEAASKAVEKADKAAQAARAALAKARAAEAIENTAAPVTQVKKK